MAKKPVEPVKRGPGRPKSAPTTPLNIRVTLEERDFFLEIGGSRAFKRWLRERMEKEVKMKK
jgi:hypothetical protein